MSTAAELAGKTALVTGASSGIGAAIARTLSAAGARVVLAGRRRERLAEVARGLVRAVPGGGEREHQVLELDVRDWQAVRSSLSPLAIDVCIANAGLGLGLEPLQEGDPDDWGRMIDTNVKGLLHTVRAVAPGMLARGSGDVVLIGSVAGRAVYPKGNVYCATKWSVRAIYEALRLDLSRPGIRVSTVDPGIVETEFSLVRFKGDAARAEAVYQGLEHLEPEDVADAVRYVVTRPARVNVGELVLWPSAQASTTQVTRAAR
jgi:NADP-dependent 3-hydroxy acid dehydrogenase YdfG